MSEQDQRPGKARNQLSSISGDEATGDHAALTVSDLNNAIAEATAASATISDALSIDMLDNPSGNSDHTLVPTSDLRTPRSMEVAPSRGIPITDPPSGDHTLAPEDSFVDRPSSPLPPLAGVMATSPTLAPSPGSMSSSVSPLVPSAPQQIPSTDRLKLGAQATAHVSSRFQIIPNVHYRIDKEIARGGMGRILLAFDHRLQRQVAIKELLLESSAAKRRFKREALITARLQHPSIVNVYEAGCWPGGEHFYAMEKVNGRSLQAVIDDAKTLQARLGLLPRIIDVSEALAYAHAQGVIHRDLKPDNILVGSFGETVVIDWGLAKDLNRPDEDDLPMQEAIQQRRSIPHGQLTLAGSIMGTPGYMPPEQAEGQEATTASDVYAIGAILYHLLAGEPPFKGESSKQVLMMMLSAPPEPLASKVPDLPPDLISIVDKAMHRDPERRYKDAGALSADLRRFETGKIVASHAYSPLDLARRWVRRYRTILSICAVALVGLIVIGVISFRQVMKARDVAEQERNAARDAQHRLEIEHREAVAAKAEANQAAALANARSQEALERANDVAIHEARSALQSDDPSRALAWLRSLNLDGKGWDAAHLLALGARYQASYDLIFRGHARHPQRLALSDSGQWLAAISSDGALRLWDTFSRTSRTLQHPDGLEPQVALDPAGRWLAAVTRSRRVVVADLSTDRFSSIKDTSDTALLAVDPTGKWLAIAQTLGGLSLYNPSDATHLSLENISPLSALAFSPDGQWLASSTTSGLLTLRSTDGKQAIKLPSHSGTPSLILFSPNSRYILALDPSPAAPPPMPAVLNNFGMPLNPPPAPRPSQGAGTVLLIDLNTVLAPGGQSRSLSFKSAFTQAAFSNDSQAVALSTQTDLRLLDLKAGLPAQAPSLPTFHPVDSPPLQLAFSADSRLLVWRSDQGVHAVTVSISNPENRQTLPPIPDVRLLHMFPHDNRVAVVHDDRSVRVLNLDRLIQRVDRLPNGKPAALAALPSGKVLVAGRNGGLWRWSLAASPGQAARPFLALSPPSLSHREENSEVQGVSAMFNSADAEWVLLRRPLRADGFTPQSLLEVWRIPPQGLPTLVQTLPEVIYDPVIIERASPEPPLVAFFSTPLEISVADLDRERVSTYDLPSASRAEGCVSTANALRASPDGQTLAILAPCVPALWLLDLPTQTLRGLEFPESRALSDVLFTPDGQSLIVAAGQAGTLRIDRNTWRRSKLFDNAHDAVTLSVSPSGQWLTANTDENVLRIWDLSASAVLRDLPLQNLSLSQRRSASLVWSPSSRSFVTTFDGEATLWDVGSGESRVLKGHSGPIASVAWSDDSRTLLTASLKDGTLRAWPDDLPTDPAELHAWLQENVLLQIDANGLPSSLPSASTP